MSQFLLLGRLTSNVLDVCTPQLQLATLPLFGCRKAEMSWPQLLRMICHFPMLDAHTVYCVVELTCSHPSRPDFLGGRVQRAGSQRGAGGKRDLVSLRIHTQFQTEKEKAYYIQKLTKCYEICWQHGKKKADMSVLLSQLQTIANREAGAETGWS